MSGIDVYRCTCMRGEAVVDHNTSITTSISGAGAKKTWRHRSVGEECEGAYGIRRAKKPVSDTFGDTVLTN